MKYKISQYARKNNVTVRTVWTWISKGKVVTERTTSGGWLIVEEEPRIKDCVVVYARVSSSENKDNLESQKNRLISYANARGYRVVKVVTEIGSGLNDKRPRLEQVLLDDSISRIIVEHKDRLARFGVNYIEKLLEQRGRVIEYVNPTLSEKEDLLQDFVSIITSFAARLYGQRRGKRNTEKLIKELELDKE